MNVEEAIRETLKESAPITRELFLKGQTITSKQDGSIVTESDAAVEEFLHGRLNPLIPNAYFFGEESSETRDDFSEVFDREYLWAIDPIDGTNNFANGSYVRNKYWITQTNKRGPHTHSRRNCFSDDW